jgi:glyoxylase-like metal-dependent hydrolase (beta-lactamase superfamily II)
MLLRPFLNDAGSCASYLFGCTSHNKLAVVDPHSDFVDDYLAAAAAIGAPIVAVFETHVQADHVSGLPALVDRTGARAYLPAGTGVEFEHVPLSDWEVVELGNTLVTAIATPGHAPAHHVYAVADRRRGTRDRLHDGLCPLPAQAGRDQVAPAHVALDQRAAARDRARVPARRQPKQGCEGARRCNLDRAPAAEPARRAPRPRSDRSAEVLTTRAQALRIGRSLVDATPWLGVGELRRP